jgi:hypothetical protein
MGNPMTPDPYEHVREAFHITADGLMDWEDPPIYQCQIGPGCENAHPEQKCCGILARRTESRSKPLGGSYREADISTLEKAAESLARQGDFTNAVALWALALRVRHGG